MIFNFEDSLKKNYQKKLQQKEKKSNNKEGALCVFSFLLCGGAM
jgi:hypothetical protein